MTTHKAIREALPAIPAELLHLCETGREAVRRYALQVVQSIDPARFAHGHNGDSITIYMDGQPVHWVPVDALTQALATTEPDVPETNFGNTTERKGEPVSGAKLERDAFEVWTQTQPHGKYPLKRDQEGQYWADGTEVAWDAWQARASLLAPTERKGEPVTSKGSATFGALMALTRERNKLHTALELACSHLTDEQAEQVAAAMPTDTSPQVPEDVQRKVNAWNYLHGTTKLQMDGGDREAWVMFHRLEHIHKTCPQNVEIDAARKGE